MKKHFRVIIALLACLFFFAPSALAWQIGVGEPMPHRCYSVADIPGLGLLAGSYEGDGHVYTMDPETLEWRAWRKIPVSIGDGKGGHESIAYFMPIDGRAGVNAFTEDSNGPECYTAWADQGWQFTRTPTEFPKGTEYALGGPEAAALGLAAVSAGHGRRRGAVLTEWAIDALKPTTTELWHNGQPCLIWTATKFKGHLLAGASASTRYYNAPGVGVLAEYLDSRWINITIPEMAGIVRLTQLPGDPGALYLCTTHGDIWRTDDFKAFAIYHQGDGRHGDAWICELHGRTVVADAHGRVWVDGQCVLDRPGTTWMSPTPYTLSDGRQVLVGTITNIDEPFSRPFRIDPPLAPPWRPRHD